MSDDLRIAAFGDVHFTADAAGSLRPQFADLPERADLLLIAGDITRVGEPEEARFFGEELADIGVPVVAVLGNHDYHRDMEGEIAGALEAAGVTVLEGSTVTLDINGWRVGVAGIKGFGGGFGPLWYASGEPETRAFIGLGEAAARRLGEILAELEADVRIALLHYSPIEATVATDPPQLYPFLGSSLLGEAIDRAGADLVLHGHVHLGVHEGTTPGGVPVRNVSRELLGRPYALLTLAPGRGPLD